MTVAQVERLAGVPLEEVSWTMPWMTHSIRKWSDTEVMLGFRDGKLRHVQVASWVELDRMASYPKKDLC
jgi:hypothetical protein